MKFFKIFSSICLLALICLISGGVCGQVVITSVGSSYTQDFNTLANSGTSILMPTGWFFNESGTSSNNSYSAGTGSGTSGDTYSFGSTSSSERSLGTLISNNLTSTIGASFSNNTGFTINSIGITYVGEQWRLGTTGRLDKLDFQYSIDATSISNGTWTDVNSLDFTAPITSGTLGALDGNNSANRVSITSIISGLSIANGVTISVRWTDFNSSGADDGLGIDDFSLIVQDATLSGNASISNITIIPNSLVTLQSGAQLTLTGTLTNNGTMTIESGASLVQTTNSSTVTGSGTYQVKQTLNASGRFWYLGVPLGTGSYTEQNFLDLLGAGDELRKRNEASSAWDIISGTGNNTVISAGKGFNLYINNTTPTLTFQGTGSSYAFNNGSIPVSLTSSGSSYTGYNLVCNPYPSYVDWSLVSKTGLVDETIWYRIYANGAMTFGTINTGGISTTVGGVVVTKYLPPMQAFWVKAASGGGSLTFDNEDRTHFVSAGSSVAGLKNTGSNHVFIRMNVFQGEKTDQLIVYTEPQASPELDAYDSDKMMQLTLPQIYTKVGNQKTVINALHPSKKRQSIPVIMELPSTGVHHFEFEELEIGNGIIWLEDKQEEIMQALEPGTVYEFYANSGINAERFVLHFQLIDDATLVNVYNEVNSSANFSGKGASVHAESAGVVVIKLPATTEGVTDIQIRDAAGRLVYTGSTNTLETSIQLAQANGIYYVTLNSSTGVEVRKVFIQQ